MTESSSFSSLLALVDSHLSKTSIQGSGSDEGDLPGSGIPISTLNRPGTLSETGLSFPSGQRLPIPSFILSESPIKNVLAEQVTNMLKAKEKKQREDEQKRKLEEEIKRSEVEKEDSNSFVIDLVEALRTPYVPEPRITKEHGLSNSSSCETLFEPKFDDCDVELPTIPKSAPTKSVLPCVTDMSYILKQKVPKGKCSNFGKVLISRYRIVPAPYLKERINSEIVKFDFKTKSPCDINKEKQKKPYMYQQEITSHFWQ